MASRSAKATRCSPISCPPARCRSHSRSYTAAQMKKMGAPIDWFGLPPVVAMPNSIAIAANAPRPYAAMLFFDFMLSDAQKLLLDRDYVVTSTKFASTIDPRTLTMMDAAKILQDGDKWQRLYTQIITGR